MIYVGNLFSFLQLTTPDDFKYDYTIQDSLDRLMENTINEDVVEAKKFVENNIKDSKQFYFTILLKVIQPFYDENELDKLVKNCIIEEFGEDVLKIKEKINIDSVVSKVFYQMYKKELLKVLEVKQNIEYLIYNSLV